MQEELILTMVQDYEPEVLRPMTGNRSAYYFTKRLMDLALASVLLLVSLPIMIVIGIAIFAYSPGPIFFKQERVGAKRRTNGKVITWEPTTFQCIKFRTMKLDADSSIHKAYIQALIENNQEQMHAVQNAATRPRAAISQEQLVASQNAPTLPRKLVNDARVIGPGKILRKLSLDELPQLWNVMRGDMSMIGPRPAIPYEVEMYKPWHMLRLQAQPGLSGLQQVTARCILDFDVHVYLVLEYIEKQSIWLDL
jgi:lipopolysaccharide/colanic/teichoic acid biosynthesis glycosyltransferase